MRRAGKTSFMTHICMSLYVGILSAALFHSQSVSASEGSVTQEEANEMHSADANGATAGESDPCAKRYRDMTDEELEECEVLVAEEGVQKTPWYVNLALGSQFEPDYSDEGKNEGFDEHRFFGAISLDGKWMLHKARPKEKQKPFHWNVGLDFLSEPVVTMTSEMEDEAGMGEDGNMGTDVIPTDFNDIADAATLSTTFLYQLKQWDKVEDLLLRTVDGADHPEFDAYRSNLGPFLRIAVSSREELGENNDSINTWGVLGVMYTFERYKERGFRNGQPKGFASLGWGVFEDFGGLGWKNAVVIDAGYQLPVKVPIFLGSKQD